MKLWHCYNTRSLRALWALEEMGLEYEVETLSFPPRLFHPDYLEKNPLGTVPYFVDADVQMTESSAICLYLVEKYKRYDLGLTTDHPEYAQYLNWLFQSDATFTFPQALVFRYSCLETTKRQQPQVVTDYAKWFLARLRILNAHLEKQTYLCDERFTIADIAVGYALHFGEVIGLSAYYKPQVHAYLERLQGRGAFKRAMKVGEAFNAFKDIKVSVSLDR